MYYLNSAIQKKTDIDIVGERMSEGNEKAAEPRWALGEYKLHGQVWLSFTASAMG